jgi:major membrane immunogen (membrane-anchored lipoprotein)
MKSDKKKWKVSIYLVIMGVVITLSLLLIGCSNNNNMIISKLNNTYLETNFSYINTSYNPREIVITADHVTFSDRKIKITFNNSDDSLFNFENVNDITFKLGNKSYKYTKEGNLGSER